MSKLAVTKFIVGNAAEIGVGTIVGIGVRKLVAGEQMGRFSKVCTFVGMCAIAGVVGKAVHDYSDNLIDEIAGAAKEAQAEVKTIQDNPDLKPRGL